jgi:hypothetical protein
VREAICSDLISGALLPRATSTANKHAPSEWDSNRRSLCSNYSMLCLPYQAGTRVENSSLFQIFIWKNYSQIFSVFWRRGSSVTHTYEDYFHSLQEQNQTYFFMRCIILFHPLSRCLLLFGCFKYLEIQRVLNIYMTASVCLKVAPLFTSYLQVRQEERFLSNRRQSFGR